MNPLRIQKHALVWASLLLAGCHSASVPPNTFRLDSETETQLKVFFAAKEQQARRLKAVDESFYAEATTKPESLTKGLASEVWPYFAAGKSGDWKKTKKLYLEMAARVYHFADGKVDERLSSTVWQPINESFRAYEQLSAADPEYIVRFGREVIDSIPPRSVLLTGTDAGRFVVTFLTASQMASEPFCIVSQNGLPDFLYREYLRSMYAEKLHLLTPDESHQAFQDYLADAQRRLEKNLLMPGEDVKMVDGRVQVSGRMAVRGVAGSMAKKLFDMNPDIEFFLDEEAPMAWTVLHLVPHGFIFRINREPLVSLSPEMLESDQVFWARHVTKLLGNWLTEETQVRELCDFAERVYLLRDLSGFTGDPRFVKTARQWSPVQDYTGASAVYSKARGNIAAVYALRAQLANSPDEKDRMTKAADFAFRQALVLCPYQAETVEKYLGFLSQQKRFVDLIRVARVAERFHPKDGGFSRFLNEVANATEKQIGTEK